MIPLFSHLEGGALWEILVQFSPAKVPVPQDWAQKHVKSGEVLVIVGDNQPVMSKLRSGSIQGHYREIWEELKLQAELFKKGNRMLQVWTVRSYENEADHLAGQHPKAAVWKIKVILLASYAVARRE